MKHPAKETFENNMHHHHTMKTIAIAYLTNRKSSFRDKVYNIFPELKLRKIAVYFVNINLPEEKFQLLFSKK